MRYLLLFLLLTGCTHNIPNGEYVIHVPAMDVIVTDKHFPVGLFGMAHREWLDGAWRYTIFIKGNQTGTGIMFPRYIFGHEAAHILNWIDPKIRCPHKDFLYKSTMGWWR